MFKLPKRVVGFAIAAVAALAVPLGVFAANSPATPDYTSLGNTVATQAASVPSLISSIGPPLILITLLIAGLMLALRLVRHVVGGR